MLEGLNTIPILEPMTSCKARNHKTNTTSLLLQITLYDRGVQKPGEPNVIAWGLGREGKHETQASQRAPEDQSLHHPNRLRKQHHPETNPYYIVLYTMRELIKRKYGM